MAEEFDPYAIVERNDGEYDLVDSVDTYNLEGFRPGDWRWSRLYRSSSVGSALNDLFLHIQG